ncbi:MAG: ATP-binding cassette domain-containing protein [Pseudomonadota bacterium]
MSENIALPATPAPAGKPGWQLSRVQQTGAGLFAVLVVAVVVGPMLSPYGASETVCAPFAQPSAAHLLGCNDVGQDLLTGILTGGRVSLGIGLATALVTTTLATIYAVTAAYRGGAVDLAAMRFVDAIMALPFLPLVIVLGAFFGGSIFVQVAILCLVMWAQPVRELRAQALNLRSAEYVSASRAMGASAWRIVTRHIVPELAPLIVPQFVRVAHNAILIESALSFLGLGDPVQKSWGTILFHANARTAFLTDAWLWWVMPPGLLIALSVVSLALIGHGVGDRRNEGTVAATERRGQGRRRRTEDAFEASDVTVGYGDHRAVDQVSLTVANGDTLGLVGESGSGKSTLAMAAIRLLPPTGHIDDGSFWLGSTDLLELTPADLADLRGQRIALVPQSAMNALNPVQTVRTQIVEAIRLHRSVSKQQGIARAAELLDLVHLPRDRLSAYPHELSGGMRQRVVIAIALANDPEVLIADEPTTGLDVLVQAEIMALLRSLSARLGLTVLFVTHDLPLIASAASRLAIMQAGRVVEEGAPEDLARQPRHSHTKALFDSVPHLRDAKLWQRNPAAGPVLLDIDDVAVTFNRGLGARLRGASPVPAVRGVSLQMRPGEVVGLVGGSGSGKTTVARIALGLIAPDRGHVTVAGQPPRPGTVAHMVFQDPYQSMRPAMRVEDVVGEPLRIAGQTLEPVAEAVAAVRLPSDPGFLRRPVGSLSGGQRQRVAFARAIVTRPRLILADEPTSMLDQSLRAGLLGLMEELRREQGAAFLFITHDLPIARHFCDRIAVMHEGRIVEQGPADEIAFNPTNAYTKSLIAAAEFP